ncbi:MAG: hypothetical protein R2712_08570 [Vicinamibacterales bacterium]
MLHTSVPLIDVALAVHREVLGRDLVATATTSTASSTRPRRRVTPEDEALEKLAAAAVFHDLGIWTAGTFDYLEPSVALAVACLDARGRPEWVEEVAAMIRDHHKLRRSRGGPLAEAFRRADWIDVTLGVRRFGIPRIVIRQMLERWPSAGFHRRLGQRVLARVRTPPRTAADVPLLMAGPVSWPR